jgi:hypothetical protein
VQRRGDECPFSSAVADRRDAERIRRRGRHREANWRFLRPGADSDRCREPDSAGHTGIMTMDEAREIAIDFAKLPELLERDGTAG